MKPTTTKSTRAIRVTETRPCFYEDTTPGHWNEAIFHAWSLGWKARPQYRFGYERLPDREQQVPVAIIEDQTSGDVLIVDAVRIRFKNGRGLTCSE